MGQSRVGEHGAAELGGNSRWTPIALAVLVDVDVDRRSGAVFRGES